MGTNPEMVSPEFEAFGEKQATCLHQLYLFTCFYTKTWENPFSLDTFLRSTTRSLSERVCCLYKVGN